MTVERWPADSACYFCGLPYNIHDGGVCLPEDDPRVTSFWEEQAHLREQYFKEHPEEREVESKSEGEK